MSLQNQAWFNPSQGEYEKWSSHPSFIVNLPYFLFGLVVAVAGLISAVYIYFFQDWPIELVYISLIIIPFGLGFTAWKMLVFKNTWYGITNRRVIRKTDVVGRTSSSKPHREIVRVDVNVSTMDAILSKLTSEDIGDIIVRTADDSGDKFVLHRVPEVSLAESYIERLSGTGPNTPARYDAEERQQMEREHQHDQRTQPHQSQQSPDGHSSPAAHDSPAANTEQHAPEHPDDNQTASSSPTAPEPQATDDMDDEFDQFEPSDKA